MTAGTSILDRFLRWFFFAGFVAIIATGAIVTVPRFEDYKDLVIKRERIKADVADREAEILLVQEKQKRFSSDREFVESIARENRRVFPGELVFVFDK